MKKYIQVLLMVLGLGFGIASCAGSYYVTSQPGEPAYARPASPGSGYLWIDGEWGWSGGQYIYTNGYWSQPRVGYNWHRGYWNHGARGYNWHRGGWGRH